MTLEPIEPEIAVESYLKAVSNELAKSTQYAHKSRLGHFVRWCGEQNLDNLNELTGRKIQQYRVWRREDGDLSKPSEKTQMDTLRVFVRWLESIDAVEQDLHVKVRSPSLSPEENARDVMLERETADKVLSHLRKYEYASRPHVSMALLWHTMMRVGAARALDLSDYYRKEQYLEVVHRPETDTPIKNKQRGERLVAVSDEIAEVIDDWIQDRRPDVVDEHGREPLLATSQGRPHPTTLRKYCYQQTRPCVYTKHCPHNRDIKKCPATDDQEPYSCPSVVSPHAIRRGAITNSLKQDVPEKIVGDRANVSQDVLEKHYDRRSEREKMEQRRGYLDNL
ncbi:tyrosine-type recombinase/integrase [Halobium palmae]|uniref:Tyrosine-type recombinase/integrase n=1 Tax=Halobium palmae TaxID=1776492 RepID=A0ABD5RVZ1_9EURY